MTLLRKWHTHNDYTHTRSHTLEQWHNNGFWQMYRILQNKWIDIITYLQFKQCWKDAPYIIICGKELSQKQRNQQNTGKWYLLDFCNFFFLFQTLSTLCRQKKNSRKVHRDIEECFVGHITLGRWNLFRHKSSSFICVFKLWKCQMNFRRFNAMSLFRCCCIVVKLCGKVCRIYQKWM